MARIERKGLQSAGSAGGDVWRVRRQDFVGENIAPRPQSAPLVPSLKNWELLSDSSVDDRIYHHGGISNLTPAQAGERKRK